MYRPVGWNNPYCPQGIKPMAIPIGSCANAYEAGADAMLTHIIELAKKSAPSSKLLEIILEHC